MSYYEYDTIPHVCAQAKRPIAMEDMNPWTVVRVGITKNHIGQTVAGYRTTTRPASHCGMISQENNTVDGEPITRFQFNRDDDLVMLAFAAQKLPSDPTGISVTFRDGGNIQLSWSDSHNAYVYPYPAAKVHFRTGTTVAAKINIVP